MEPPERQNFCRGNIIYGYRQTRSPAHNVSFQCRAFPSSASKGISPSPLTRWSIRLEKGSLKSGRLIQEETNPPPITSFLSGKLALIQPAQGKTDQGLVEITQERCRSRDGPRILLRDEIFLQNKGKRDFHGTRLHCRAGPWSPPKRADCPNNQISLILNRD